MNSFLSPILCVSHSVQLICNMSATCIHVCDDRTSEISMGHECDCSVREDYEKHDSTWHVGLSTVMFTSVD